MINVVIMASGEGSNALALIDQANKLTHVKVRLVIVDNPHSAILKSKINVPIVLIEKQKNQSRDSHEESVLKLLKRDDWIFLAGYRRLLSNQFVKQFKNKIVNIHPSLLPQYPGLHAYERAYHDKVLKHGATVHFVDSGIDTGAVIDTISFDGPFHGETIGDFIARGKQHEWELYRSVLMKLEQDLTLKPKLKVYFLTTKDEKIIQVFFIDGGDPSVLCDHLDQQLSTIPPDMDPMQQLVVRTFRPGVTDNTGMVVRELTGAHRAYSGLAWVQQNSSIPVD